MFRFYNYSLHIYNTMVVVGCVTIVSDEHFQWEDVEFDFYECSLYGHDRKSQNEIRKKNEFIMCCGEKDDENGIYICFDRYGNATIREMSHEDASDCTDNEENYFYTWKELWELYHEQNCEDTSTSDDE